MKINKTNITFSNQKRRIQYVQHKKENSIFKPRVQPSFLITLITWENTACVYKNEDVKFSANDAFLG